MGDGVGSSRLGWLCCCCCFGAAVSGWGCPFACLVVTMRERSIWRGGEGRVATGAWTGGGRCGVQCSSSLLQSRDTGYVSPEADTVPSARRQPVNETTSSPSAPPRTFPATLFHHPTQKPPRIVRFTSLYGSTS